MHINRVNGIIMEILLKTGNNIPNISILNTYAPHMGYNTTEINDYWGDINNYLNIISTKLVKFGAQTITANWLQETTLAT